ncbi:MAG: photosynthetic complex putative assembly protein PuhB [Thermochromatium sp.]
MREYDFEPIPGLPERLPPGEEVLWQGAPSWQSLARRAFHVRKVAIYFGVLAVLAVLVDASDGLTLVSLIQGLTWILLLAVVSIGALTWLGWLMARSSLYTITNRRVVMRIGVALPMMVNLPFKQVRSVDLRVYEDGTGEIPLLLDQSAKTSYIILWPHVRPWHFAPVQPMLRTIPEASKVAGILVAALQGYLESEATAARVSPNQVKDDAVPVSATETLS